MKKSILLMTLLLSSILVYGINAGEEFKDGVFLMLIYTFSFALIDFLFEFKVIRIKQYYPHFKYMILINIAIYFLVPLLFSFNYFMNELEETYFHFTAFLLISSFILVLLIFYINHKNRFKFRRKRLDD